MRQATASWAGCSRFSGKRTLRQGIFREVFPALKEELAFFGYDWLGRLYFVDSATNNVKMVDALLTESEMNWQMRLRKNT